jgi:peptidoglycan glycosyltransferase
MKKADPNPKANRNILKLVYVIVALFLGLIAYMAYFLQARGEDVINNSYNARLDSFADRIIRGKILGRKRDPCLPLRQRIRPRGGLFH